MVDIASTPDTKDTTMSTGGTVQGSVWMDHADFLLQHAILAPSSHNTQPWIFEIHADRLEVHADLTRWLRIADADRRELHVSLGCALENLVLAAEFVGFAPVVSLFPDSARPDHVATLRLQRRPPGVGPSRPVELLRAVPARYTERDVFGPAPVSERIRSELGALAVERGVQVHFTDHPGLRRTIRELTVRADEIQCADPAWRKELAHWIGEGAFGTNWLLSKIGQIAVRYFPLERSMSETDRARLASAPLLGLVSTTSSTPADQVRAGQVFERLFLAATNAGLVLQPMNQILQVPEVRDQVMDLLPEEWRIPQMTFRLGYAELDDRRTLSPRRPLEDVVRWHGVGEA